MNRLQKEASEVEAAIENLNLANEKMNTDALMKIASLKNAGILKQSCFTLFVLFSLRTVSDLLLALLGLNAEAHLLSAGLQTFVAAGFGLVFFRL